MLLRKSVKFKRFENEMNLHLEYIYETVSVIGIGTPCYCDLNVYTGINLINVAKKPSKHYLVVQVKPYNFKSIIKRNRLLLTYTK